MLIVCPKCTTSYELEASTLGAKGRSVRCVRCKGVWFADPSGAARTPEPPLPGAASDETIAAFKAELSDLSPPAPVPDDLVIQDGPATAEAALVPEPVPPAAEEPPIAAAEDKAGPSLDDLMASSTEPAASEAPAPDSEPAAAEAAPAAGTEAPPALALSEITIPVEQQPAPPAVLRGSSLPLEALRLDGAAENIEIAAARRSGQKGKRKRRGAGSQAQLPALIIALLAIVATLFAMRNSIVKHAPQMASFYEALGVTVNLRGLAFTGVKLTRDTHDGVPVLVIEGSIVNATKNPVEVPRLRFALRNEAGSEVYSWTALPAQTAVLPGEALPFRSRLASPPNEARDVQVRFFTRRDAVAGLR